MDDTTHDASVAPYQPTLLTLSYGGTKGIGQIGALRAIEHHAPELLAGVDTFIGCSAGAVNALLMSLGFSLLEMLQESLNFSIIKGFNEMHLGKVFDKATLGFISNEKIRLKIEKFILTKYTKVPTLAEAFRATGKKFEAVAVNHTKSEKLYFNHETTPNLSVIDAMLMSMNIPILFFKYNYNSNVIVDGALKDPYPILKYDDGTRDILGISIIVENLQTEEDTILPYYNKNIGHALEELRSISVQRMSHRCKSLDLTLSDLSVLDTAEDPNSRYKCYIEGYRQAEAFIAKLRGQTLAEFYGPFIPPPSSKFLAVPFRKKKGKSNKIEIAKLSTSVGSSLYQFAKSTRNGSNGQ